MEAAQKQANKQNLLRYKQLLSTIKGIKTQTGKSFKKAFEQIQGVGDVARQRVEQGKVRGQASAEQDLISRGLGNTTIRSSVRRGIADDAELQQQGIDEMVAQQRSGLFERRAGMQFNVGQLRAGAIEGRNDIGPNMSLYAQLLQAAAAGNTNPITASVGRGVPSQSLGASLRSRSGGGGGGGGGTGFGGRTGGGSAGGGSTGGDRIIKPIGEGLDLGPKVGILPMQGGSVTASGAGFKNKQASIDPHTGTALVPGSRHYQMFHSNQGATVKWRST